MKPQCKHFDGIQNISCLVKIRYSDVLDSAQPLGKSRLPCLNTDMLNCPKREMQTTMEAAEGLHAFAKAAETFVVNLAAGICPTCDKPSKPHKKVGRCLYGACGHRIGQGDS